MNVEIGAEAVLFPEKKYINGIAVAVIPAYQGEFGKWHSGIGTGIFESFFYGVTPRRGAQRRSFMKAFCIAYSGGRVAQLEPYKN